MTAFLSLSLFAVLLILCAVVARLLSAVGDEEASAAFGVLGTATPLLALLLILSGDAFPLFDVAIVLLVSSYVLNFSFRLFQEGDL